MSNSATTISQLSFQSPLRLDEAGTLRVGKSRVTLDLIVDLYENGMSPEDMIRAYDSLELADVHAAIACYLQHREEIETYLNQRKIESNQLKEKVELLRPKITREELLARRTLENANASTSK